MNDIRAHKRLLIISDSGMCMHQGKPHAFGPVVMELHYFLQYFDEITWMGGERDYNPSFYRLDERKVQLRLLPEIKSKGLKHKWEVLLQYPKMRAMIKKELPHHQVVHVRAPSHPALVTMILAKQYSKKRFWFKYAGSWVDPASRMYDFQRKLLRKLPDHCRVTVNGNWPDQPAHVLSFENPCLTQDHRKEGKEALVHRTAANRTPYDLCFVGGLNDNKGIIPLLEVWALLEHPKWGCLHIVGEGPLKSKVEQLMAKSHNPVKLHGTMTKEAVHKLYVRCEAVLLPTKTEGFPKVIGEAMNYGCIPIVTDVSCIGQYIKTGVNGYLMQEVSKEEIEKGFKAFLELDAKTKQEYRSNNYDVSERFTYDHYMQRLIVEVFPTSHEKQQSS